MGDRKSFAVAICLYKLAQFHRTRSGLQQRANSNPARFEVGLAQASSTRTGLQMRTNSGPTPFEVVSAKTGLVLSEDIAGAGLPELVLLPKGQWIRALHISTVLRLHRVGFKNVEIARLLPGSQHATDTDTKRDAKAIGAVVLKYRAQPAPSLRDFAYTPANWPQRLPSKVLPPRRRRTSGV